MSPDTLRPKATLPEGEFHAWDTMAVELEVAELLYALVRQMKPQTVVEAGSGKGYASVFLAAALRDNGKGTLYTYEPDPDYSVQAAARLSGMPALVFGTYSLEHRDPPPDIVFIDSLGGDPRERDMDYWFAHEAQPLIVVHDANGYPDETFTARGEGVFLRSGRGVWIGRARP